MLGVTWDHQASFWVQHGITKNHFWCNMGTLRVTLGPTWDHHDPFGAQPVITKKHFRAAWAHQGSVLVQPGITKNGFGCCKVRTMIFRFDIYWLLSSRRKGRFSSSPGRRRSSSIEEDPLLLEKESHLLLTEENLLLVEVEGPDPRPWNHGTKGQGLMVLSTARNLFLLPAWTRSIHS